MKIRQILTRRAEVDPRRAAALALAALVAGGIGAAVVIGTKKPAKAQVTANSPVVTVTSINNGNTAQIVAYNPSRRAIQICVATTAMTIVPVNPPGMPVVTPSATVGIPVSTGAGNCYSSPFDALNSGTGGGVGAAWQAFANGGTSNVTVLEY